MQASYRIYTASLLGSTDPLQGRNFIQELTPSNFSFTRGLNQAGNGQFTVAKIGAGGSFMLPNSLEPTARTIWVERNGQTTWAGIIWEVSASSSDGNVSLTASEFPSYFEHVRLDRKVFSSSNTFSIIRTILGYVTGPAATMLPIATQPDPAYIGAPYFPIWYEYDNRFYLDLVNELQKVGMNTVSTGALPTLQSQGFEWTTEYDQKPFVSAPWPSLTGMRGNIVWPVWTFWSPRAGQDVTLSATGWRGLEGPVHSSQPGRTASVEYGPGTSNNALQVSWTRSGRRTANRLKVTGAGQKSMTQRWTEDASVGQDFYPTLDAVANDPDLKFDTQVKSLARDLVARTKYPSFSVNATFVVDDGGWAFDTWSMGDRVTVIINDAGFKMHDTLRVTALSYSVQGQRETATVGLTPDLPSGQF